MDEQKDRNEIRKTDETASTVIPVVQEQAIIHKEVVESGKVKVQTRVVEVEKNIDIPLVREGYDVERVPVNKFVDTHPQIREEGDTIIIPVVREVLVVEKKLEVVEELHLIKRITTENHKESFTLRKEEVHVQRIPTENSNRATENNNQ